MAKHKKKKKKSAPIIESRRKKPFPKKRALTLLGITSVIFILFEVMIALEIAAAIHIYWITLGVIAVAYIAINRGTFKPLSEDDLSDDLSKEEKTEIINTQAKRFEQSRPLLYIIIGIIFTLLFDSAYLYATLNLGLKL